MPLDFEAKVHDVTGVLKLALPCAALCHDDGFDWIGIRTEADQVVGPLEAPPLSYVRPNMPWRSAWSVGSRQTPRSRPLSISLANPHQTR